LGSKQALSIICYKKPGMQA